MTPGRPFYNLYSHDFVRVALAIPEVRVANPRFNAEQTQALIDRAADSRAALVLFPELGMSAYTCDDLFHQQALLAQVRESIAAVVEHSRDRDVVGVIGAPLQLDQRLFNCAIVFQRGRILGVVPKTFLPNYREFYELRQFNSGESATFSSIDLCGQENVPFGKLLFQLEQQPLFRFHVELCEDLWVPIPPSCYAAMAGATVLLNMSASNITVGKSEYRHQLVANQSARCLAAYLFSTAGVGESTTDLAWDGQALVYENGNLIAESKRFSYDPQLVVADLDLERLASERMKQNSFGQAVTHHKHELTDFRIVNFSAELPRDNELMVQREYERFPYVPADDEKRDHRCYEAYEIQVQGLVKRLRASGIENVVVGVSGGLDSTQTLIVCARAMDVMGYPRTNIHGITMPGFATSSRTLDQAHRLMKAIGCTAHEIDIKPSCEQMLRDIGHPFAKGEPVYDIAFENVQAGERTSHLFRFANHHGGLVAGTGDLSELALGWTTYGVGDHMSHYNVNGSVPKTLIRYLIRWAAETDLMGSETSGVLDEIFATEISPELVPGDGSGNEPAQLTEDAIGPYELHDFFLYYTLRFGYPPPKVAFLAYSAWKDAAVGDWPNSRTDSRTEYSITEIRKHLRTFLQRFFATTQFKRSCVPNSPKVGSGGSLSPRADYRAPSDGEAQAWLDQLELIPNR